MKIYEYPIPKVGYTYLDYSSPLVPYSYTITKIEEDPWDPNGPRVTYSYGHNESCWESLSCLQKAIRNKQMVLVDED